MADCDVIVVGAGPAGCAAAYDLCQWGRSVLLLDRHEFPRAKACAGGLTVKTLRALRYSIQPVLHRVCYRARLSLRFERERVLAARAPVCAMVVREEFDEFCLRQTCQAGADFRKIQRLRGFHEGANGVRVETDAGVLTGRFLIGADGADSQVRKLSGQFQPAVTALALEGRLRCDDPEMPDMTFDFGVVDYGYGWAFPKRDHVNIGVGTFSGPACLSHERLAAYAARKFPGRSLEKAIGHRLGIGGWAYHPTSPRVFLVGDAAGLTEPLLGEGIHNAVASGQAAAAAIERDLSAGEPALGTFRRRMRPILQDLRSCYRSARLFYGRPTLGYAILTNPVVRHALIRGFAGGLTLRTIKRFWWLSPLFPRPRVEALAGTGGADQPG